MNKYFIGVIVISIGFLWYYSDQIKKLKADNNRISTNFEQVTKDHIRELTLKKDEYDQLNADWKDKLDSVLKAEGIKIKHLKEATNIETEYRDTGSVKIRYRDPVKLPDQSYIIPVSFDSVCWGMSGQILSNDKNSKLDISERKSVNSVQLIITEKRRWIFWKRRNFEAFTDCGKVDVTKIQFKK